MPAASASLRDGASVRQWQGSTGPVWHDWTTTVAAGAGYGRQVHLPAPVAVVPVAAGAFAQRVSGIGFSLIAGPALTLLNGPREGVMSTNLLTIVVALAVFATAARHLEPARAAVLIPAGLAGILPGTMLTHRLPAGPLQVAAGAVTGLGLAAVLVAPRLRAAPRLTLTAGAGLVSGFTTAVAGAGGPALAVYAVVTDWSQPQFAATSQVSYAIQAAAAAAAGHVPAPGLHWLGAGIVAALAGLAAGHLLATRISDRRARRAAIALATVSCLLAVINGLHR